MHDIATLQAAVCTEHEKTMALFQEAVLDTATRNEYKRQVEQYESMVASLQQMRALSTKEETAASLDGKIADLLAERVEFEKYCAKQFAAKQ